MSDDYRWTDPNYVPPGYHLLDETSIVVIEPCPRKAAGLEPLPWGEQPPRGECGCNPVDYRRSYVCPLRLEVDNRRRKERQRAADDRALARERRRARIAARPTQLALFAPEGH